MTQNLNSVTSTTHVPMSISALNASMSYFDLLTGDRLSSIDELTLVKTGRAIPATKFPS